MAPRSPRPDALRPADAGAEGAPPEGGAAAPARGGAALRWAELLAIYVGLPAAYAAGLVPMGRIPFLIAVTGALALALLLDPAFDRRALWNAGALRGEARRIGLRFLALGAALAAGVAALRPELFLALPLERPGEWALFLVAYPLLSVYPQEVAYRTFFYHRYAGLFGGPASRVAANAALFGAMHVVYGNALAVVLTALGGLLFAGTYERTRSTAAASAEHALYGALVFTLGLGAHLS